MVVELSSHTKGAGSYVSLLWFGALFKSTSVVLRTCPGTSPCYHNAKLCHGMIPPVQTELPQSCSRYIVYIVWKPTYRIQSSHICGQVTAEWLLSLHLIDIFIYSSCWQEFFSAFSSVPRCWEEEEKKVERPFHLEGTCLFVRVQKNAR